MKADIQIGPSLLASDLSNILSESVRVLAAGADFLHLDVMDGHFVPNLSFGPPVISSLRKNLPLAIFDVHLMVSCPERWVDDLASANVNIFTFHLEAVKNLADLVKLVKDKGMRVGVAIKPRTNIEEIFPFLDMIDLVLIMTVEPGFGGQSFMPEMLPKIATLRSMKPNLDIEVDGGISLETAKLVIDAGANMLVAGTAVFRGDVKSSINLLRNAASTPHHSEL